MISLFRGRKPQPYVHPVEPFITISTPTMTKLAELISSNAWTPAALRDGYRKELNWMCADFIALDFDNSELTLEQARRNFADMVCVIGTTINHQKAKFDPSLGREVICDRYRVILKLDQRATNIDDLRYTIQKLIRANDADWSAHSPVQYFRPCVTIEYINEDGYHEELLKKPGYMIVEENIKRKRHIHRFTSTGELPDFCAAFLERGECYKDGRNSTAFSVALMMLDCGIPEDEVRERIERAPYDRRDLKWKEIPKVIDSAVKRFTKGAAR